MAQSVYFDTSIFIEMGTKRSKYRKALDTLLKDLKEQKVRIYTSILTVQEFSVAAHRKGAVTRDTMSDIRGIARIYSITNNIALTAAKREAEIKDLIDEEEAKRDISKPLTKEQELERMCENRRRKWDAFHIATAQVLGCSVLYSTDGRLQKRPTQLGIKNLDIVPPPPGTKTIKGPLFGSLPSQGKP